MTLVSPTWRHHGTRLAAAVGAGVLLACGRAAQPAPTPPEPRAPAAQAAVDDRLTYGPFAASYRAVSRGQVEQEFGSLDFRMRLYLRAEVARQDDAFRLMLRVDSVPELEGTGMPASDAARAAGTTFVGRLSPEGAVLEFGGGDSTVPLVKRLASTLRHFFPQLPEGGVRPGLTWTDTTRTQTEAGGITVAVEAVTRYEAVGWTVYGGSRALHVEAVSDYTVSGGGSQGGQEFTIDGTGIRHEHHYLADDGRYLGNTQADTSHSTALVTANGATIPITQTRVDTLTVTR